MRIIPLILSLLVTCALIFLLNRGWNVFGQSAPPMGTFLSPQQGFWQNAEPVNENFSADLKFTRLNGKVNVYLDERLIPHVFAEDENDAYFVQGYLHAKFRLWQMELQTLSASGRLSEILGEKLLERDREFRRLGMMFAAERTLKEIEKHPRIKSECDAYTAGINSYIGSLTDKTLPLEYKLSGYKPENWNNLKTAIFMKYMSYELAGHDDDFEMTNARSYFNADDFNKLFPAVQDSLDPVIPKGTIFEKQKIFPIVPQNADSLYFRNKDVAGTEEDKPDKKNGSNLWAVSGKKTSSGAPIFCNDPHLSLNLPSVWFEIQISVPEFNVYGVGFPGAPGVMIGYNDSCAFGFTNGGRDVRDYYEIKFKDESRNEYLYNGSWMKTQWRIDSIKVRDRGVYIDSVAYVLLGENLCPVMYDKSFSGGRNINHKNYAVRWKAHDAGNELLVFNLLDRAKNYSDYLKAIVNLKTPGQNSGFADKQGDIAIRTQGEWPAKWKGQGDFIMPGYDSSFLWQGMIPEDEIPFQFDPERGFVSSANQKPVDDVTYPYYLGRNYPIYRGMTINRRLAAMNDITPQEMMQLQTDNYNLPAEIVMPVILKNIRENDLTETEKKYLLLLKEWNMRNDTGSKGATVFEVFWSDFYKTVYDDEYANAPKVIEYPLESSLLEGILKDSSYKFLDNVSTSGKETLSDDITLAFKNAASQLAEIEAKGRLNWDKYKTTHIIHLSKLIPLSSVNLHVGGSSHNINAIETSHGPSWRMVVSLTEKTEAYGVYPGGQSGNPGSRFYDNFIDYWAAGKYYTLWMMTKDEEHDKRVKWKMSFSGN